MILLRRGGGHVASTDRHLEAGGGDGAGLESAVDDLARRYKQWVGRGGQRGNGGAPTDREGQQLAQDVEVLMSQIQSRQGPQADRLRKMHQGLMGRLAQGATQVGTQALTGARMPNMMADMARHRLQSMPVSKTATTLMTERLHDDKANCIERATMLARPGQDDVLFMRDNLNLDGDNAGHALIQDKETGRIWDPNDGTPPPDATDWKYESAQAWVDAKGNGPEAYTPDEAIDAHGLRKFLEVKPEAREAYLKDLEKTDADLAGKISGIRDNAYAEGYDVDAFRADLSKRYAERWPHVDAETRDNVADFMTELVHATPETYDRMMDRMHDLHADGTGSPSLTMLMEHHGEVNPDASYENRMENALRLGSHALPPPDDEFGATVLEMAKTGRLGRGRSKKTGRGSRTTVKVSRTRLARNLESAGHTRPSGTAAHHMVAGDARAQPAQRVLKKYGVDIDAADNGVFLPRDRNSPNPGNAHVHSTLHTDAYYAKVNRIMSRVTSRAEATQALDQIRRQLQNGTFLP